MTVPAAPRGNYAKAHHRVPLVNLLRSRRSLPAILIAAASLAVAWADGAREDIDLIQGTWSLVELETAGGVMQGNDVDGTLTITGESAKIEVEFPGSDPYRNEYSFRLFPHRVPKAFDVHWADGRITRGIYRFEGQQWIRCHGEPDGQRPESFENPAANRFTRSIWQRPPLVPQDVP